jgi:hypothetical protein
MSDDRNYQSIVILCNVCTLDFELRLPMIICETMVAVAEAEGETPIFPGRCPACQERDPFLKLLKEAGITTVGGLSRRIER